MSGFGYKDNPQGRADKQSRVKQRNEKSERSSYSKNKSSKKDCPLKNEELGRATWSMLHTIAAYYPDKPDYQTEDDVMNFFFILSRIYPCPVCAKDLQKKLQELPINTSSQKAFSQWLCELHNKVNHKLGKPLFDCSKVNERWKRTVNKKC